MTSFVEYGAFDRMRTEKFISQYEAALLKCNTSDAAFYTFLVSGSILRLSRLAA